ncbi:SUF system Fe-S cluster assembly regulator [bacterium]|nr:SUF system Fe-S cluster assembly regulator [bacterium]
MIRLSRMADYAVVIMSRLAMDGTDAPVPQSALQLSDATGLSQPTVSKILKHLVKAGIATSARGSQGGHLLARLPTAITVADIIEAVDGPIALTDCSDHHSTSCDIEKLCPTSKGWKKLNHAVKQALATVTLADMMMEPWEQFPLPASRTTALSVA